MGAKALATDDIGMSMLLAVAGARLDDSPATRSNLLAVLGQRPQLIRSTSYDGDKIVGLEVSPDGRTVAVYDLSGQVTLYDATTMEVLHTLPGGDLSPYKWFAPMAFSPDGATLAVGMPRCRPLRSSCWTDTPWSRSRCSSAICRRAAHGSRTSRTALTERRWRV